VQIPAKQIVENRLISQLLADHSPDLEMCWGSVIWTLVIKNHHWQIGSRSENLESSE
tara:strand:- start:258 stop:428 length:171 start_codon:yes stop_codon:yes gene_type:complete